MEIGQIVPIKALEALENGDVSFGSANCDCFQCRSLRLLEILFSMLAAGLIVFDDDLRFWMIELSAIAVGAR